MKNKQVPPRRWIFCRVTTAKFARENSRNPFRPVNPDNLHLKLSEEASFTPLLSVSWIFPATATLWNFMVTHCSNLLEITLSGDIFEYLMRRGIEKLFRIVDITSNETKAFLIWKHWEDGNLIEGLFLALYVWKFNATLLNVEMEKNFCVVFLRWYDIWNFILTNYKYMKSNVIFEILYWRTINIWNPM